MPQPKSANRGWVITDIKLTGKTVLITGANSGIGLETAIDVAKRDARVLIACRNVQKADKARNRIIEESGNDKVIVKKLDLASFESIKKLAQDVNDNEERLDVLINNAGILVDTYRETKDGFETHFGVNHLGTFLLTNLLIDLLKRSAPSRIVTVASSAYRAVSINWKDPSRRKNFKGADAYAQSKLMNILFSRELSKRLTGTEITSYSLHPGVVHTAIMDEKQVCTLGGCIGCIISCLFCMACCHLTPAKGAQTTIYCAVAPELETVSGKYYTNCRITREARHARNDADAKKLWELSEELIGDRTPI